MVLFAMTVVELIAFVTAIARLIRIADLRKWRNVVIVALGALSLVPAIGTFLMAVVGDRYAG